MKGSLKQITLKFMKTTQAYEDNPNGDNKTKPYLNSLKQSDVSVGQRDEYVQGKELIQYF